MFSEDPILLPERVDQIVLVTVHPASEREDEELQRRRHSLRLLGRLDQHRPSLGRFFAPYGIHPSFGFVEEPETNGVAERWNRTLKEQAIHGRIFQNLEAVRAAVADFVERYNQTWRLEKLGYHTPIEAREEYELCQAA